MAFYNFQKQQLLKAGIGEVWDFISSPENLELITPEYLGFKIRSNNIPEKIYPGMIIIYEVRPLLGIPMTWVTEITHVEDKRFFVDEQRIGPYSFWHHQHHIEENEEGVLMTDIVSYKPPFGILGTIANTLFIRQQLDMIFSFREKALNERYASV